MKLYRIKDWNDHYENNRSRTVADLAWVPIPNRHDGFNYSQIMAHPRAAEIFSVWILVIQVASRCQPRGTLMRDDGKPHSASSLALKTRAPEKWFNFALDWLCANTDWLEVVDVAGPTATQMTLPCQAGDEEQKGMERTEGKEQKPHSTEARVLIHWLNEKTGRRFREVAPTLRIIDSRLEEPDVTLEGCKKMIERQCTLWKDDPKMSEYLRPETLFNPTKFNSYYAARDLPAQNYHDKNTKPNPRNAGICVPASERNGGPTLGDFARRKAQADSERRTVGREVAATGAVSPPGGGNDGGGDPVLL